MTHPLHHAEFMLSVAHLEQLPVSSAPEIAFAGRSNAGKSTAINILANRTRLAFVSKTPGRTQQINFFRLSSGALLADLPGYGYAQVPPALKQHWQALLSAYLQTRESLVGLVLVMDARRPLTKLDDQMLSWFLPTGRPVHVLLTKADKLNKSEQRRTLDTLEIEFKRRASTAPVEVSVQLFSSVTRVGILEAEKVINRWIEQDGMRDG